MTVSYKMPHARNLPLPVISRKPSSTTILSAARGVTSSVSATIPADTSGFAMTSSTSSGSLKRHGAPPASFWRYLGDRLGISGQAIPPLAGLVVAKA
jgi:hypothetical protein